MTTFYTLLALQVADLLSTVVALRNPRLIALCVLYAVVVANNVRLIRKS